MPGAVSDVGSPFDPNLESYPGPTLHIPSGIPQLVAFPNPNGSLDVAWLDTLSPKIVVTHTVPTEAGWENAWHFPLPTLERLGGYARDEDGNRDSLTMVEENALHTPPRHSWAVGSKYAVTVETEGMAPAGVSCMTAMPLPTARRPTSKSCAASSASASSEASPRTALDPRSPTWSAPPGGPHRAPQPGMDAPPSSCPVPDWSAARSG